jgi:hypothetical protein
VAARVGSREPSLKGKAQYGRPPSLDLDAFDTSNIINITLFTTQDILMRRSTVPFPFQLAILGLKLWHRRQTKKDLIEPKIIGSSKNE